MYDIRTLYGEQGRQNSRVPCTIYLRDINEKETEASFHIFLIEMLVTPIEFNRVEVMVFLFQNTLSHVKSVFLLLKLLELNFK